MYLNINCKYFEHGGYCKDKRVKRSLLGIGARVCKIYYPSPGESCDYQEKCPRPPAPGAQPPGVTKK